MITSSQNQQIKRIRELNEKPRSRREAGLFVAEGVKLFRECPESRRAAVFVSESFEKENAELLAGVDYEAVADHLFARITDTKTPQGILTLARIETGGDDFSHGTYTIPPVYLILEDLQDAGNVGTILRTAEAAGVTGVILGPTCADVYQPKAVRATMGSIFRVPFKVADDLPEAVRDLQAQGVRVAAAHLDGETDYRDIENTDGIAFLIGNEGKGLSDELTEQADIRVRIPMAGQVESLNASVAAAILVYRHFADRRESS